MSNNDGKLPVCIINRERAAPFSLYSPVYNHVNLLEMVANVVAMALEPELVALEHIQQSDVDSCGSVRMVCICGTHYNTNPATPKGTARWIIKHAMCRLK